VFYDPFRAAAAYMSAINMGWPFRFELVLDCTSSWYTHGRPLARTKHCAVWGSFDYCHHQSVVTDGLLRNSRSTFNSRGTYTSVAKYGTQLSTLCHILYSHMPKHHVHEKPIEWIAAIIGAIGLPCITDMFGGSCNSIVAANVFGYTVTAYEIDQSVAIASAQYCTEAMAPPLIGELFSKEAH
jgi:hypothetical protein